MTSEIRIGDRSVGEGHHAYIVAEIGINHNGDVALAEQLIDAAAQAGCDAVKFQKRDPETSVPPDQRDRMRDTPWGHITYLDYRKRVEFGRAEYERIARYAADHGIAWFASCWDEPSVDFMEAFDPPVYKVPSASVTDIGLLKYTAAMGRPIVLSTGMSTMDEIRAAVEVLDRDRLVVAHSTSTYPCPPEELNLRMLHTLKAEFDCPVGYSGHEVGLPTTVAAVALGACYVERHVTLDRSMWGSDQAASVEPGGIERLVHYIRTVERGLGDGVKRVYSSELEAARRLRRINR
jgi:N-acetylneuraminate synthase